MKKIKSLYLQPSKGPVKPATNFSMNLPWSSSRRAWIPLR